MFEQKRTQSCFESAFRWQESIAEIGGEAVALCLPKVEAANLVDLVIEGLVQDMLPSTTAYVSDDLPPLSLLEAETSLGVDNLDPTTVNETPNPELRNDIEKSMDGSYVLPSTTLSSLGENRSSKQYVSSYTNNECGLKKNGAVVGNVKRQKINKEKIYGNSSDIHQSKLYTAKLQSLLDGDMTMDIEIGDTTLANIVSYECQDITTKL